MIVTLTPEEARVLGALMEKERTTPEYYPLSLNAVINACNQKSSRDPVMTLDEAAVGKALFALEQRGLVWRKNDAGSRVPKFGGQVDNLLANPTPQETGTLCVLLLRGPQTPGEIRSRSGRLCEFTGVAEAETVIQGLAQRADGPFVAKLPRQPGMKESRYTHLFSGAPEAQAPAALEAPAAPASGSEDRLARLEKEVAELKARLDKLAAP